MACQSPRAVQVNYGPFWGIFKNSVFPIRIYWGHEKPDDSNLYLNQFCVEAKELLTNGVNINGVIFKVIID